MIGIVLALAVVAGEQTPRPAVFIEVLLNTLVEAQRTFDAGQLNEILAPDYVEISPAGEVDPRDKVLSFYAPDKKIADPPAAALEDVTTRVYGETAVTIATLTYRMRGPDGADASRSMRCVFVTRIVDGKWKLVSAQYTPIRK
jgi:ketosteroid isomerase-like protein